MISRTAAAAAGAIALMAGIGAAAPALAAHTARAAAGPAGTAAAVPPYPGHPLIPATTRVSRALAEQVVQGTVKSANWAGYAATKKGVTFRRVQATFFVPYLNCATGTGTGSRYSSHWVGIDGYADQSVEQDGIEADCFRTSAAYHAWYEFYPKPEKRIGLVVRPGQSVTTSVSYNKANRKFTLAISDNTSRRRFSISLRCTVKCERASAEVISEAPTLVNSKGRTQLAELADYGAASYTGISITTTNGLTAGMISPRWHTTKIVQASLPRGANVVAQPTTLHVAGFSDYWQRPG